MNSTASRLTLVLGAAAIITAGAAVIAQADEPQPCHTAIRYANQLPDLHDRLTGTQAAHSIAIDMRMGDEKVAAIRHNLDTLRAAYADNLTAYQQAAADC